MGEFELIDRYLKKRFISTNIAVGNGDDCAVLDIPEGMQLAVSTDSMIAGRHFFEDAPADLIAHRAFAAALSDLAAMGAKPLAASLALALPAADEKWLAAFSEGLFSACEQWGCPIVGGDTVRGPLAITFHVKGLVARGAHWLRSGAQVGDAIYITGELGGAAAALDFMLGNITASADQEAYFKQCYFQPTPRFDLVEQLAGRVTDDGQAIVSAAIDISDGLLADLAHICRDSSVGARLDVSALPMSSHVRAYEQANTWALSGGDDYQVCFTVPNSATHIVDDLVRGGASGSNELAVKVGTICAEKSIFTEQKSFDLASQSGFDHFL